MSLGVHDARTLTPVGASRYESGMKKIAISLPDAQASAIERIRRRRKIPRSRVIQEAIAVYLQTEDETQAIRAYQEGYRRHPEGDEAEAFVRGATEVLGREDWE